MSQSGPNSSTGSGASAIETLTGNSGGPVGPDASFNIDLLGNNSTGIDIVGTPASNLLTVIGIPSSTTQVGTLSLATDAESISGAVTDKSIVPSSLSAKLGDQTADAIPFGDGTSSAIGWTAALTDGQLAIGSSSGSPAAANLTSTGGTIAITNGANSINLETASTVATQYDTDSGTAVPSGGVLEVFGDNGITTSGSSNTVTISCPGFVTPFVVSQDNDTDYSTIQSALDAANAAGGGIVFVRPGTYTEDLTLYDLTQVVTAGFSDSGAGVEIIGVHTPPTSGGFVFRNCKLSSSTHIFSSAAAGTSHLIIADAAVSVTNGYTYNLPNWNGIFESWDVNCSFGTNDGFVNNSGGSTVLCYSGAFGVGSGNVMMTSGPIFTDSAEFFCPVDFQSGTQLGIEQAVFYNTVTASGNSQGDITIGSMQPSSGPAFTMNSSGNISLSQFTINSSNNPCIDGSGAGTLQLSQISFLNNASISGSLTLGSSSVYPVNLGDGELLIGSAGQPSVASTLTAGDNITIQNGAGTITISANGGGELAITSLDNTDSPYTVLSSDEYLSCDVSGGVLSILLPDAPTTGRVVIVKDSGGDAVTNNITVTTVGGGVTIDGSTTFVMNTNYQSASFVFNGTSYEVF